jgi:MFS family permease
MLVTFASGPGQSFVFTVFIDPIIEDTGFSRTTLSSVYAAGTLVSALAVMIVSRIADRRGPRAMLLVVATVFGLACFGLSLSGGLITMSIALALLRGLGQGAMPINSSLLVAQWFVRNRGRALSILGLGGAVSIAIMPNLGQWLIETFTWRGAYVALGFLVWALVIPVAILVVRNRPEDIGLFPDGARTLPEDEARRERRALAGRSRRVLTSFKFWTLAIPMALPAAVDTALIFHQVALFQRQGLSAEVAARVFVPFAVASALAGLAAGFIVDRVGPKPVFMLNMTLLASGVLVLQLIDSPLKAVGYAVLLGVGMGMQQIVSRFTWPFYYGRHGLGQVQGSAMMVLISATAVGPLIFSALAESPGGYTLAFGVMVGLLALAAVLMALYRPVRE